MEQAVLIIAVRRGAVSHYCNKESEIVKTGFSNGSRKRVAENVWVMFKNDAK